VFVFFLFVYYFIIIIIIIIIIIPIVVVFHDAMPTVQSGTYVWTGSEAPLGGVRPTYAVPYSAGEPSAARVKGVLDWMALPHDKSPAFTTLYFDIVDTAGTAHFYWLYWFWS
jgi:hypothetical protein